MKKPGAGRMGFARSRERDLSHFRASGGQAYTDRGYHRSGIGLNHLAFSVPDKKTVDTLYDFCRANGVTVLYEDRHPFANGGAEYYALFVEDPDRIKVEFVAASVA